MVTRGVDIQSVAMLTDPFGYTEIRGVDSVFLRTFKVIINVRFQFFVLLRSRLDLDVALMRRRYHFFTKFAMDISATGMSFE